MMINQEEYKQRRCALMEQLADNSIVIIRSADVLTRSNDTMFRFRQHNHFYYLTGLNEPSSLLVLIKGAEAPYHLFLRPKCYAEELWDGPRPGIEGAKDEFNADLAYDIAELPKTLPALLAGKSTVYYLVGDDSFLDKQIPEMLKGLQVQVRKGVDVPSTLVDIAPIISEMRLIKSDAEISLMRKAAEISAKAHVNAMKKVKQSSHEYQLHAGLLHDFICDGAQGEAYDSIVGAGGNACVLHYIDNDQSIEENGLVLIDAGAEYKNYAADITRTFPASGKFSDEQRAIYELVLKSQMASIELIKPGVCWTQLQECIVSVITTGLCELGLLQGSVDECISNETYKQFYMHNSGHWLGLDVHDVGAYRENGKWRDLKAGMVLTVEPGIYIASHHQQVDSKWHNIGVRIEDDVLVTDSGYDILTDGVAKLASEVEALVNGG